MCFVNCPKLPLCPPLSCSCPVTMVQGVILALERLSTGPRGAGNSQAAGTTLLQLALALITVQLQLRPRGAFGYTGQLSIQLIHEVELSVVLRSLLSALFWVGGVEGRVDSLVKVPPALAFTAHTLSAPHPQHQPLCSNAYPSGQSPTSLSHSRWWLPH